MTESSNTGDRTISVKKTLGLKRSAVERDTVRQSFSHGRTNTVQVERKKRRIVMPGDEKVDNKTVSEAPAPAKPRPEKKSTPEATGGAAKSRVGRVAA